MSDTQIILKPEGYYHVYNHAVGSDNLFENEKDYNYFLTQLKKHILPVGELLAYCLMPNHFHLIVRIKNENEIQAVLIARLKNRFAVNMKKRGDFLSEALSQIFSNFFNTYAKHYNFWKNRRGSLFKRAFRRKEITGMEYFKKLICYIHQNPVEAGFAEKPGDWKYSSYKALIGLQTTLIPRKEIVDLFGDLDNFIYCHSRQVELETS